VTSSSSWVGGGATLNRDAPDTNLVEARAWVLQIQTKLHQWAKNDPNKRFDDLFNLVCHPATLAVAWDHVKSNQGSRTAGVDRKTKYTIVHGPGGAAAFLVETRSALRGRVFRPSTVRQRGIPKATGKVRYLGIPTIRDRLVQMALKLILEPIFEADFVPTSYGFRPNRRAQDAIAEVYQFLKAPSNYEYVIEGDIEACFDRLDHVSILSRVRKRVGDKRVLALIKAFLKAAVLTEIGTLEQRTLGSPQGGIISPLLSNVALAALDEHFERAWREQSRTTGARQNLHRKGRPTYRLIRYADDLVVAVKGTREHAEALKEEMARVLATQLKLTLSAEKTLVTHIDDGFNFLGFRIQRKTRGSNRQVYTWPSPKAFAAVKRRVKTLTRQSTSLSLGQLLYQLNPLLRGWTSYFRYAASKHTFAYLDHYAWWRVVSWLRKKHRRLSWKRLRRRHLRNWEISDDKVMLFRPARVRVERYRYRGTRIPRPWEPVSDSKPVSVVEERVDSLPPVVMESRVRREAHARFGGRSGETG
jgi:RNA-directed DNA polymerase